MKKIINGKVYNTETAKCCAEYEPSGNRRDFHWFCETLYLKKNGEFFLHGEGGAASSYAESCGLNEWCGGEKIVPLTYEEAAQWAEKHLDGDEYEGIFGEIEENDAPVQIHVSMTQSEAEIIKRNAAQEGMTVSAYIVMKCAE